MTTPFDLAGKVAIVTGGNGGIGLAMASGLARAGADVAIAARSASKAVAAIEAIEALGRRATFHALDAGSKASCAAMVESVMATHGRCDILVNNAGINVRKMPEAIDEEEWRSVIATNLDGAMFCSQAAHRHMKAAGSGKILNIGSMYSLFGAPMVAAYAASKGGIAQLTKALAAAWAADNIQVNAILPGWIDTDLTVRAREQVEGLADAVVARTPSGRWGQPDDLAPAAVFLCSAGADFVTGVLLPVDGGYSARG